MARQRKKPPRHYARGFGALCEPRVTRAYAGCDFDFLRRGAEAPTPDPEIH